MDREEIIRMAREAEFTEGDISLFPDTIAHFAALVAAAEREAIAKSLDKQADLACDESEDYKRGRDHERMEILKLLREQAEFWKE